jgi:hypothetical protein
MQHMSNDNVSMAQPRRSYQRPELLAYGAMRDVTRGGAGGTPEGMGQGKDRHP